MNWIISEDTPEQDESVRLEDCGEHVDVDRDRCVGGNPDVTEDVQIIRHRISGEIEMGKKYPVDFKAAMRTPSSTAST